MKITTPYGKANIYSSASPDSEAERVLVVPGYSETIAHSKKLVGALADTGFSAATFSPPRRAGKHAHRVKDPIQRQGNVVLSLVEAIVPEGTKVHVAAHSLGTAAVLRAAQEAPQRFASLTLMQPLGMVGKQGFLEMAGHVGVKITKNQAGAFRSQRPDRLPKHGYAANMDSESAVQYSARVAKAQLTGAAVLAKQTILSLNEALAAGKYEIANDVAKVTDLGIPVHMMLASNDEMFDSSRAHIGYEAGIEATSYSMIADQNARHDTFWLQPERTARIMQQLIHS